MSRRARLCRLAVQLHLWLGLTIGALWALQGTTGALLAFHRDIDRTLGVRGTAGPPASLDALVAAAGGRAAVLRIGIRDGAGDVLVADRADHRTVLIDRANARVLAVRATEPSAPGPGGAGWRWLYRLHEALLLGDRGETLIGISGLFLLSAALVGLWLGWPRGGSWRIAFSPARWRTSAQRLYGWHRAAGLPAALGLVLMTLSGAWMIFAADLRPWLTRNAGFQPAIKAPTGTAVTITPGAALASARREFPAAGFVRLTMPTPAANAYVVRLRQPGETRAWSGVTSVTVDAASGRVLGRYDPRHAPLANRLADAAFAVHSGEIAGIGGRLAVLALGLSLPLFYITGLLAWLGKRRRRARNRAGASGPTILSSRLP